MLLFKILSHPAVVLATIAIIVVAGEAHAGLYFQFFIMNLLGMNLFAVICAIGLIVLFFSYMVVGEKKLTSHAIMNCLGIILIAISVYMFFYWLPWENTSQTFTTFIPLCTVVVAAVCTISFLVKNIRRIGRSSGNA